MSSLTGQQINNSYQGLLKTEDNAAITGTVNLTDGEGTQTGLRLEPANNKLAFSKGLQTNLAVENTGFVKTNYPMSAAAGNFIGLALQGDGGAETGSIKQDRYGSVYYENINGNQFESHVFRSKTNTGAYAPGVIRIDTYNSTNNSTNWFTGYNQSVTDLQVVGSDLTLSRQGAPALTVTLPGGGGGTPGLVNGTGTDSLKSSDALTTNPSVAPTQGSIILGDGATLADNPTRPTWGALGHIGIGKNINITENSFTDAYSKSVIAIGQNAQVNPYYDGGNIAIGHSANSTNMHGISIGANSQAHQFAVSIGQFAQATAESTFALGRFANASTLNAVAIGASTNSTGTNSIAIGQGATAESDTAVSIGDGNTNQNGANMSIGRGNNNYANGSNIFGQNNTMGLGNGGCQLLASNINVPAGINDFVGIGRISNPSGNVNNSIQIGLVSSMTNAQNSVAIGRGSSLNGADNSVAIGRDASCTTAQSAAVGYNVTATRSNFVTVNELELKTVGGGIIMPSPDGTLYKITVSNTGDLVVSAA